MRKFIIKTILISLPILVIAFFMEILLRNIPNDYMFKKQYLDKHSEKIETLILGSSHTFYGINPDFFTSNTFNASHISQSLNFDYEIMKKYEDNFKSLKTIVLPISYFTLFTNLKEGSESWRLKNYIIYYEMETTHSFNESNEILVNKLNINLNRLVSYYLFENSTITCSKSGWGTKHKSINAQNLLESGKNTALRHTMDKNNSNLTQNIIEENILILNSIVKWCSDRNINILLLTPPAFQTYRENLDIDQLNYTIDISNKIALKYGNCIYLNLMSDTTFVQNDFYDADHLSDIGAKKLSNLINNKIKEIN